jgi:transcriptional regulator with XRE-family HTH domain
MDEQENPNFEESQSTETNRPLVGAGQRVREAREKAGISLAKLASDLRISVATLEALEAGQYEKLAGAPYVRATLVSLARPLRLDAKDLLKAYADEIGGQETPSIQVSPYKDDSGTHAKAHKQIFILLLAVLLFILLLIMGKVNTSSPDTEPATPAADTDTLLNIDPVMESDSLSMLPPDSTDGDTVPARRDLRDTGAATPGSREAAEFAARETRVRVVALTDSVWLRILPAGDPERSLFLRRNKPLVLKHDDAITFITRQGGMVRLFLKDSSLVPTERRFKVDGGQIAY